MDLAGQLRDVVMELEGMYGEYAVVLESELRAKVGALEQARNLGLGVGATDDYLTIATFDAVAQTLRMKWDIRAKECVRDWLVFVLGL